MKYEIVKERANLEVAKGGETVIDYRELERRILTRIGAAPDKIPAAVTFIDGQEYTLTYCIVQALIEYDKMRYEQGINQKDGAERDAAAGAEELDRHQSR